MPGGVFGDYFSVVGSSGSAGYQVTNIQGAHAFAANLGGSLAASIQGGFTGDINGDLIVDAADLGILLSNFGSGTTVSQGDINLAAPGDDMIDAADIGVMYAAYNGDPGPATLGTATAEYDPATGQIVVSVDGVNNWYIERVSSSLTIDAHTGLLAASLVTDNDTRIGESTLALFSYSDQNLGNVAEAGLPLGDLRIYWNAGLGQPLEMQQVTYLGVAAIVSLPEPTTLSLLMLGLGSLATRRRKSFVR